MKKYIYVLFTGATISLPTLVHAGGNLNQAGDLLGQVGSRAGAGDVTIEQAIGSAIGMILSLVGLIFLVLMVYAGILWLTSRGEEGQVEKARKIISATIIGLVVTISAYAITYFVTSRLGS